MNTLFGHDLTPDPECHVAAVRLFNYKAASDLRLELGQRLHVFVGDNGAGKTTVLDGIAAGLAHLISAKVKPSASGAEWLEVGPEHARRVDGRSATQVAVVVRLGLGTVVDSAEVQDPNVPVFASDAFEPPLFADTDGHAWFKERWRQVQDKQPINLPVIAYYTADRAAIPAAPDRRWDGASVRGMALRGAFGAETSYGDLVSWFSTIERAELYEMRRQANTDYRDPQLEGVRAAVRSIVPGIRNVAFDPTSTHLQAEMDSPSGRNRFTLDELSGGGRVMMALAADLARRMIQANPHLGLNSPAIVLIDEIDLHLHPKWQATVIDDLMRTFPKAQFIVSTHSEQIIGAVPSELVRVIRTEEDGIRAYAIGAVEGARFERILEDGMGLSAGRNQAHQDLLDRYWKLVDAGAGDEPEGLELRAELDGLFQGKEPELARADIVIRRLRARKGQP
jgi:predicted ATP-binding protein involved in virulence